MSKIKFKWLSIPIAALIAVLLPMWMLAFDVILGGMLIYIWLRG